MARPRTSTLLLALVAVLVVAAGAFAAWLSFGQTSPAAGAFEEARIVRVVDGDTLVVNVGGKDEKLRLIGIDAPESVSADAAANVPEGELASAYLEDLVKPGQTVYLQKDTSDTDKYGRLLRYVWLEQPHDPITLDDVRTKMVNGILVADGFAQAKRYKPDVAYAEQLEKLQSEAVSQRNGVSYLWS